MMHRTDMTKRWAVSVRMDATFTHDSAHVAGEVFLRVALAGAALTAGVLLGSRSR